MKKLIRGLKCLLVIVIITVIIFLLSCFFLWAFSSLTSDDVHGFFVDNYNYIKVYIFSSVIFSILYGLIGSIILEIIFEFV